LIPAIRELLSAADPQLVMYRPTPLDDVIGRGAAQRLFTMRILLTFAAVALALAALGLFGVLSYGVKLRTREFGIRMALGAERRTIRRVVLRQGLTVAAIGVALGLVVAVPLSKLMRALLFQVSPLDPWVIAGATLFTGVVATVASYLPARRATDVDPRTALQ
jgi:ABC-type antimicrobial peptide transport system permease subunit